MTWDTDANRRLILMRCRRWAYCAGRLLWRIGLLTGATCGAVLGSMSLQAPTRDPMLALVFLLAAALCLALFFTTD